MGDISFYSCINSSSRVYNMKKKGLYANINARKKKGISRPKSKSTISPKAYKNMQAGFKKNKKK